MNKARIETMLANVTRGRKRRSMRVLSVATGTLTGVPRHRKAELGWTCAPFERGAAHRSKRDADSCSRGVPSMRFAGKRHPDGLHADHRPAKGQPASLSVPLTRKAARPASCPLAHPSDS